MSRAAAGRVPASDPIECRLLNRKCGFTCARKRPQFRLTRQHGRLERLPARGLLSLERQEDVVHRRRQQEQQDASGEQQQRRIAASRPLTPPATAIHHCATATQTVLVNADAAACASRTGPTVPAPTRGKARQTYHAARHTTP